MSRGPARQDLLDAAVHEDYFEVKRFIRELIPVNITNSIGQTAGHIAAKNGNVRIVKMLLQRDPSIIHLKDHRNQTMLHLATQKGAIKLIRYLVDECGADFLEPNYHLQGITVLHIAAAKGHIPVLRYFTKDKKMDPNVKTRSGQPPAFNAASSGHLFVVRFFAEETNADLTLVDNYGDNILYMSARRGDLQVPKYLLNERKLKIDVNWRNNLGETLINRAAVCNHYPFIKYFVEEKQADVNIADNEGTTPLHEAASRNDIFQVRYLVTHGANPHAKNKGGKTPLHSATDEEVIRYMEMLTRNQTTRRHRRSVKSAESPNSSFRNHAVPTIRQRIALPWSKDISTNVSMDIVFNRSVSYFQLNGLLFLANLYCGYIGRSCRRLPSQRFSLSPQEILGIRMDSFAVDSINTLIDCEWMHVNC